MMKLILCLALACLFSSTAEALDCVNEAPGHNSSVRTCPNANGRCATLGVISGGTQGITRTCVPSTVCTKEDQLFSVNIDGNVVASSISCCNTDRCNNGMPPSIDIQTENGLTCTTCANYLSCENITSMECVGIQDRCFDGNVRVGDMNIQVRGCVSANFCDAVSEQNIQTTLFNSIPFTGEIKCCKTDLCNSAGTVRLSVALLLLGLVVLVVY